MWDIATGVLTDSINLGEPRLIMMINLMDSELEKLKYDIYINRSFRVILRQNRYNLAYL
jgi:hypothetical protein